jgi:membrane-bound ClpP family serine protease
MFHPGFGAPGIIGVILLVVGVVLYAQTLLQALILIVIILAILGAALTLVLQSATKGRLSKHLVLNNTLDDDVKFSAVDDLNYLIGSEGVSLTVLRPSGTADFNGVRLDVVSEGDFIPKGTNVVIDKIEGHRIVVKQKPIK